MMTRKEVSQNSNMLYFKGSSVIQDSSEVTSEAVSQNSNAYFNGCRMTQDTSEVRREAVFEIPTFHFSRSPHNTSKPTKLLARFDEIV
jgi:hypothetical protein